MYSDGTYYNILLCAEQSMQIKGMSMQIKGMSTVHDIYL